MKKVSIICLGLIISMMASASVIPPKWDFLGSRKINKVYDRDVIYVTHTEGTFNALRIMVTNRPITLYDMKVYYGNGKVEDIPVKVHIRAGGTSRVIDLRGGNRVIKKVVFRYETKTKTGKRAEIKLFGRH